MSRSPGCSFCLCPLVAPLSPYRTFRPSRDGQSHPRLCSSLVISRDFGPLCHRHRTCGFVKHGQTLLSMRQPFAVYLPNRGDGRGDVHGPKRFGPLQPCHWRGFLLDRHEGEHQVLLHFTGGSKPLVRHNNCCRWSLRCATGACFGCETWESGV